MRDKEPTPIKEKPVWCQLHASALERIEHNTAHNTTLIQEMLMCLKGSEMVPGGGLVGTAHRNTKRIDTLESDKRFIKGAAWIIGVIGSGAIGLLGLIIGHFWK